MFLSELPLTLGLNINTKCTKIYPGARKERSKDEHRIKVHFLLKSVEEYLGSNACLDIPKSKRSIYHLFREYCESTSKGGNADLKIDQVYLFDTLSYDVFVNILPTKTGTFKVKYLSKEALSALLENYTSWFPNLKKSVKDKLLNLRVKYRKYDEKTQSIHHEYGCEKLRRVLEAVDLIVVGFFLGGEENHVINRIQTSILSNLVANGDKGYWSFLKEWKSLIKKIRKCLFSRGDFKELFSEENLPKKFSWLKSTEFYHRLLLVGQSPDYPYNWETLEPLLVVLQTRSTGLANGVAEFESREKWFNTITDEEDNYSPFWIWSGADELKCKPLDSGIISLTSSACTEATRLEGGKFSVLQEIIDTLYQDGEYLIDWETGVASSVRTIPPKASFQDWEDWPEYLCEEIGHYLFSYAVNQFRRGNYDWTTIHLSTVVEQGKARIVTPGSILVFLLLMPLSHSTLRMLEQLPEIRVGVSDTDDGWQFWKRMGPSEEDQDYSEANKLYKDCFFCADLETATDYAPWSLVSTTLDLIESRGSPRWYTDIAKVLLTTSRKYFDRDSEQVIHTKRGALMADPVTKTILTVSHYCILKGVLKSIGIADAPFAIKGDDLIVKIPFDKSELFNKTYRKAMLETGFKLSEDDTYVSRTYGFYCESIFRLYSKTRESPSEFFTLVDKRDPSYCDVPTTRLALPTFRNNRRVGDIPEGRISLLAKRMNWMDPHSIQYFQFELLNIIQWMTFRLNERDPIFIYGPHWRGGLNKRPPFGQFKFINLSDRAKRRLFLDYGYIVSKVMGPNKVFSYNDEEQRAIESVTKSYILRSSQDDFSDPVMLDLKLPCEPIWTSDDERFWNIGLGEKLKSLTGIASDRSLKSKLITVKNLAGEDVKQTLMADVDYDKKDEYQALLDNAPIDKLQEMFDLYTRRINGKDYAYVNWELYLEKDFPLYNCMKVNPADHGRSSTAQAYEEINKSIRLRQDWRVVSTHVTEVYGLREGDADLLKQAIVLHKANAGQRLLVNDEEYDLLKYKEIDYDSRAMIELRHMYYIMRKWLYVSDTNSITSIKTIKQLLHGTLGPKRALIWASRDQARYRELKNLSQKLWDSLLLTPEMKPYTYINVLQYIPVGEQTDWGFMLSHLEYKQGFIKPTGLPVMLDPYDELETGEIVLDLSSTESTAQELVSRGEYDSRLVAFANRVIAMGYKETNNVGILPYS